MNNNKLFDELNNRFEARVRDYRIEKSTFYSHGESAVLSEGIAYIDAVFNLEIFDRLHKPALIGVERIVGGELWYNIFEVTSIMAYHLEMGSLRPDIPPLLKWDALERIEGSWYGGNGNRGGENWMSIVAVNTGYRVRLENGEIKVVRDILSPLVGSIAHIMSAELYSHLVNKEGVESISIGNIVGYDVDALIDIYSLFRYHTGIFGYTGTGKSNLVSTLLREALNKLDNLAVVVMDVSGEYPVNIVDLLHDHGVIYLDPSINLERFAESTVHPETLLDQMKNQNLDLNILREALTNIDRTYFESDPEFVTVSTFLESLNELKLKPYQRHHINRLRRIVSRFDGDEYVYRIMDIDLDAWREINGVLNHLYNQYRDSRSGVKDFISGLIDSIKVKPVDGDLNTIYRICRDLLFGDKKRVYLFYLPEVKTARIVLSKIINTVFSFRKKTSGGRNILFVVDEAHEFIPRDTRKEAYTSMSNEAMELLFRQGRKYGIGGWIATQRVAHLNTNILQQLHSYFISTLPRSYDRGVVAEAFSISKSVVDTVVSFDKGEWLFVSHVATRYPNIPVRIKAFNNEFKILEWLSKHKINIQRDR